MAAVELQFPSGQAMHTQRVQLGGEFFRLTFRWNNRAEAWCLDVLDSDDAPILRGVVVRVKAPLLLPFLGRPGVPLGELIAIDTSGQDSDPGFDDLGERVRVLFYDADSVLEAGGL